LTNLEINNASYSIPRCLDLRWQKTNYSLFFKNSEIESLSRDFNYNIELCNKVLKNDLDWWFAPLSARNNFGSPLFHHFLCFQICLKLTKCESFPENCLTDCDTVYLGLAKLKTQGRWYGQITHTSKRSVFGMFLKRFKTLIRVTCNVLLPFLLVKIFFRKAKIQTNFSTLIDTFVLPGKEFSNRYYCGATDYLNNKEISQLRFVPTFHGYRLKQYFSAIKKLGRKPKAFLLKENFLTINDVFRSLSHSIKLFGLKIPKLSIGPFDLGRLIKEELGRFGGLEDGVHGFMNFYFARRLKQGGVKINTVVNWNENHGKDRGWNYGFQTFYPKTKSIGYNMIFLSRWHLAISPLPSERRKKVLPKTIFTPSTHFINLITKNDPEIRVRATGAFRSYSNQRAGITPRGPLKILVPLSYKLDAASNSVHSTRALFKDLRKDSEVEFRIRFKAHPAIASSDLKKLTQNHCDRNEAWTDRPFAQELLKSDIVLGEWTFALLESLNAGVPVGILRSNDGLFHSSIPPGCAETLTLNIESHDSLMKLIELAFKRRSSPAFCSGPLLEPPSRNLALEVFGFRK
jgi:hypothetical protein